MQGLPNEPADELLGFDGITKEQRRWLSRFCERYYDALREEERILWEKQKREV